MRKVLFAAALLGVPAAEASAALFLHEEFNYGNTGSTLEGQVNQPENVSWLGAYVAPAPSKIQVGSGNLNLPSPMPPSSGNSAKIIGTTVGTNNTETSGKALRMPFGPGTPTPGVAVNSGGTIYYSLAVRADAFTFTNNINGGFFVGLNNSTTATAQNPTAAAARLQARIDPTDATKFNLGIFRNVAATAAATSWSGPLTVGDTIFVVASYESVAGNQNDVARLWINPDPGTFADANFSPATTPPTVIDNTAGTGLDIGVFSVLLRQSPTPDFTLDELRVGETWADVTPIPEPGALGLAALGVPALRRRQRGHRA